MTLIIPENIILCISTIHHCWTFSHVKKFYATTSFQSEIPLLYFSFDRFNIQNAPVPFSNGIKGASFLARNCNSLNKRLRVVQKLMNTTFRVDSLSGCLGNMRPQSGMDLRNKTKVMNKYLFHLSFENQSTDDYITEKLWGALEAGTIPVYFGAPNVKEFIPFHGVIYVDDFPSVEELAEYLTKVSNNQQLYESYHTWREKPLPQAFIDKVNISRTYSSCRFCRWAHARKYGLGWNHTQQTVEPVVLSRDACVISNTLQSPAVESWWSYDGDGGNGKSVQPLKLSPLSDESSKSSCLFTMDSVARAKVGEEDLIRSVWSNDGTTDLYLEGKLSKNLTLRLEFPMAIHESVQFFDSMTVWIQDDKSRISLVIDLGHRGRIKSIVNSKSGVFSINVNPNLLPLRIRIIVENQDLFHEGANKQPTYYGTIMAEDVWNPPELFVLTERNASNVKLSKKSVEGYLPPPILQISDLHKAKKRKTAVKKKKKNREPLNGTEGL